MVLADSTILLDYMLAKFSWVMEGLVVRSERMRQNLDASQGLPFSGRVLLALVEAGLSREDAYVVVQRNAMQAWESGEHLRDLVVGQPLDVAQQKGERAARVALEARGMHLGVKGVPRGQRGTGFAAEQPVPRAGALLARGAPLP